RQGFLGEAEWRQRFNNGEYSLKIAGIRQNDPGAFRFGLEDAGTAADPNRFRGMVGTKGRFTINPRWTFGWNVLVQTDKNFSRTYEIDGFNESTHRSEVYLTGLHDRNYFDLRGMKFQVQEKYRDGNRNARNDKQPWVLPSLDYSYTPDEPVFGGELNLDLNVRSVRRSEMDARLATPFIRGIDGTSTRLTGEAEWKRSFVTDGGLVVTPLLAFQADTTYVDQTPESVNAINSMAGNPNIGVEADVRSSYYRSMATAGLELRWPVLFSLTSASHVLEPMAQVFARPDEAYADTLGIPNEDAQSFVFDATTLFERDKFSGYDRIEGGTRANVGLRYTGSYANGWTTNALFGQSYHLAGRNSFDSPDLVNVGSASGLETEKSDFVGLAGFSTPFGLAASTSARLDEQTLELRRAELRAAYSTRPFSVNAKYAFIQAQPLYGFADDRHEITVGSSVRFHENWRAFGSVTYDFQSSVLSQQSIGFSYDDECFSYTMTMTTKRDPNPDASARVDDEQTFGFNISFRTLGDFGSATSAFE
ncbi:MAG: LPS assembly protein LptD, partial [Pseudaminobacter sp.]